MRLALALGKTRDELLTGEPGPLTQEEFLDWIEFYRLDPFGDQRQDLRFALLGANVGAMLGNKVKWQNLMPFPEEQEEQKQTADDVWNTLLRFGAFVGGQEKENRITKRPLDGAR
jgi:hypothetical protein